MLWQALSICVHQRKMSQITNKYIFSYSGEYIFVQVVQIISPHEIVKSRFSMWELFLACCPSLLRGKGHKIPLSVHVSVHPSVWSCLTDFVQFSFRIASHHILLIVLQCHFDLSNYAGVMELCWICTCYTLGTVCWCKSLDTALWILLEFCRIVSYHM